MTFSSSHQEVNSCGFDAHETEHMQVGLRLQPKVRREADTDRLGKTGAVQEKRNNWGHI